MNQTYLIAGLGNPGEEYDRTRHNAGFDALGLIAKELSVGYWKSECGALVARATYDGRDVLLAKPMSYMNTSGGPISQIAKKHDIQPDHIIVLHDELDIPRGTIRVKFGGGHAGHNGLRSIQDKLQTKDWLRVRIGIGRPPGRMNVADYVLRRPKGDEEELLEHAEELASEAALSLISEGLAKTQDRFN